MRSVQGKNEGSLTIVLFIFALTMALVVLWINNSIITNLREGNKRQIEKIAEFIEKHYSNNKSMNVKTQLGHTGSMNFDDLQKIRELADNLTLLKANKY